jgi:hypothetical protein
LTEAEKIDLEEIMEILSWKDKEDVEIKKFPYRGKQLDVKGISIRWLSKHGDDGTGNPEYGLRFFKKVVCGSGDFIYVPSLEPHGMKNISDTEPATFLCCICNVYDQEDE